MKFPKAFHTQRDPTMTTVIVIERVEEGDRVLSSEKE
jgi:hypothetical protein